ncbi:hypothetical protein Dimus_021996 [Dionaea muscipula]
MGGGCVVKGFNFTSRVCRITVAAHGSPLHLPVNSQSLLLLTAQLDHLQHGFDVEALHTFSEMLKSSFVPDRFTLASALSACANIGNLKLSKQIHAYMMRTEFYFFGAVENALISMYSKCGGVKWAERIIERTGISNIDIVALIGSGID